MIDYANFTPYSAMIGGALIGLAASILLLFNGKICGVSGITGQLLSFKNSDKLWRIAFFVGLVAGAWGIFTFYPASAAFESKSSTLLLVIAGVCVGFGTRLGNGCTSGHGVCGISRFSLRSIVATMVFMGVAIVTLFVTKKIGG